MSAHTLPKSVRSAISRNAHRLALDKAYKALRAELEEMAFERWLQPKATEHGVIQFLDIANVAYGPARSLQKTDAE